jgi:cyclophilin family peptidyl-prolyl cis-trans isomerase/HEAT repeat protein
MHRKWTLLLPVLFAAAVVAAQTPGSTASRRAFLWRALDSWSLPISQAVIMQQDPFASVRAQAAGVMASNVDPERLPLLSRYMNDGDARVREQVMLAAGRMGKPGLRLAVHGLADSTPLVRQAAAWAVAHAGPEGFEALSRHLARERSLAVRETLLANLWRLEGAPWQASAASYAGDSDVQLRRSAAYSLSRSSDKDARVAQRQLATDLEPVIRVTALRGFERGALDEKDVATLETALGDDDWRVRTAACRALAVQDPVELSPEAVQGIVGGFSSPHPHLAVSAVEAAARQTQVGTAAKLLEIVQGDEAWLASEALAALAQRDAPTAELVVKKWFESNDPWRRRAAARTASDLGPGFEMRAAADAEPSVRLAWLSTLDEEATRERLDVLSELVKHDPDPAVRANILSLLRSAEVTPGIEELLGFYASWSSDLLPAARAEALIAAVSATPSTEDRAAIIALGLTDTDPAVAAMVINGVRSLDLEVALPAREPRHGEKWFEELAEWVNEPRWLDVSTDRGAFRIRLDLGAAPLTSREISDLAAEGFYDGLVFHRVVPNFVVQGGDPRGDGWGGPGFVLPDEPSLKPFDSWRVGVATSGPETGGCQLFVTLLPADHLTGHYTNIGEVVAGREVLTSLRVGDRILGITPLSGSELPPLQPAAVERKASEKGQETPAEKSPQS